MSTEDLFESNRTAWNQASEYHQRARGNSLRVGFQDPRFTTFNRDCDDVLFDQLRGFQLNGKTIAQVPCNNGRELLSLMRLGAGEAVGFDISDAAIAEAKELAAISGLNARFVRTNVLEIGDGYNGLFDFIYISEGSLQWFPNLSLYFSVIHRLLKQGGGFLIFEIHPVAYIFEDGVKPSNTGGNNAAPSNAVSYFDRGPYHYRDGLDYVGEVPYQAKECYWYMHRLCDIFNALRHSGLEVTGFNEYKLEMANNNEAKGTNKLPLSYILTGKK